MSLLRFHGTIQRAEFWQRQRTPMRRMRSPTSPAAITRVNTGSRHSRFTCSRHRNPEPLEMKTLILSQQEVEGLLPLRECIDVMEEALKAFARGEMHQPLRMVVKPPTAAGVIAMMPAYR